MGIGISRLKSEQLSFPSSIRTLSFIDTQPVSQALSCQLASSSPRCQPTARRHIAQLMAAGVPLLTVTTVLGHAQLTTTAIDAQERELVARM